MTMPIQKPGQSRQDWGTPPELLAAIRHRLRITNFDVDVAASKENAVCEYFYDEERDGLQQSWQVPEPTSGWAWCNPPYGTIEPWVRKAALEAHQGANVAVLVPLSISGWWVQWVEAYAYQVHLHGRIKFVGAEQGYPKDCALLLYAPWRYVGKEVWEWKRSVPELHKSKPLEDQGVPQVLEL